MSCYMRHMDWLLDELGLDVNKANRKDVDRALRKHLKMEEADCPQIWEKVKNLTEEERLELSQNLQL